MRPMQLCQLHARHVSSRRNVPRRMPGRVRGSRQWQFPPILPGCSGHHWLGMHRVCRQLPALQRRPLCVSGPTASSSNLQQMHLAVTFTTVAHLQYLTFPSANSRVGAMPCRCRRLVSCTNCKDSRYLHDGTCHDVCPDGFEGVGNGNFRRVCQAAPDTANLRCTEHVDSCRHCNDARSA